MMLAQELEGIKHLLTSWMAKHVQHVEFNDAERCRKEMLEPFVQGVTYRFLFPKEDGFE